MEEQSCTPSRRSCNALRNTTDCFRFAVQEQRQWSSESLAEQHQAQDTYPYIPDISFFFLYPPTYKYVEIELGTLFGLALGALLATFWDS